MTEKEYKAKLTQAHTEGYNRGYAKAKQELEKENAELKERCNILDESLVTSTKDNTSKMYRISPKQKK